jgi:acylglycerol lipase
MHARTAIDDASPMQVDDVYLNVEEIKKKQTGSPPMFVGGQSMGGLVATHVALRQPELWSGLILNSAAIDVIWTPVLR